MSPNFRNWKSTRVFKLVSLMSQRRNKLISLPMKLRDLMFSLMLLVLSIMELSWIVRRKTGTSR
uniref:Alternative protein BDH2 n=1 Tax=Homo sapiens TaxID=9606 RepID=L0R823_HUMAN|nr:alternative protein BDH2 [Homo sapiens]